MASLQPLRVRGHTYWRIIESRRVNGKPRAFVLAHLGKADNLSSESTLEVKKNGRSIATLSILEIRDVMAACNVKEIQNGQRVEINDPVSILR